ncbi:MAG: hypothetical protein ACP5HH_04330 [Fervidicoccaceae archaeon]
MKKIPAKRFFESRGKIAFIIAFLVVVVLAGLKIYLTYEQASSLNGYVSDEIWYVPSSRLIANYIFGLKTTYLYNGTLYGYTIQLNSIDEVNECREKTIQYGGVVLKDDYHNNYAIAIAVPRNVSVSSLCQGISKVVPGYPMPDNNGVFEYVNPEHPPLGKYIIAISMVMFGDEPIFWRFPGIIEAGLIVIIAGIIGWKLSGVFGSALASLVAALDPLTKNMGSVAMLDIHLAFFTALGLLFYIYNRPLLTLLFVSLSGLVKYSGFFLIPFVLLYLSREKRYYVRAFVFSLSFPIILGTIVFIPFAFHYGVLWVLTQLNSAIKWHLESRPPGPPTSTPLDWVLGWNPFYLSYNPDIPAAGSPIIYVPVFISSLIAIPLYFFEKERPGFELKSYGLLLSIDIFLLMYLILYFLGNRTLYSFYFTQITPVFYASFPQALLILLGYYDSFREIGSSIKSLLRTDHPSIEEKELQS